ncbi:MAG: hypothetical protein IT548_15645 [Alphaproteobacteria bacterium]|nr:hypothetical protein [Alphaproteobacteria bacterium]
MKFAVQIRAHQVTDKLLDLIGQLRGSDRFDLFLSYDVKDGPVELPGATTLPYTLQTFLDLGLPVEPGEPERVVVWRHCDYTLYAARAALPDYDYFISIEFDVDFVARGPGFLHALIDRITAEAADPIDLIVAQLGPVGAEFPLHAPAAALYPKVYACLCPLAVFSRRALDHLFAQKRIEAARPMPEAGYVHWETFVATALIDAGGFRCATFETLFPGCVTREAWRPGLPMLMGHPPPLPPSVQMIHPVLAERECALRHSYFARIENRLPSFLDWLDSGDGRLLSPAFRESLRREAAAELARQNPSAGRRFKTWLLKLPGVAPVYRALRGR